MWIVVVNRLQVSQSYFGPFDNIDDAQQVRSAVARQDWVRSATVRELLGAHMDGTQLVTEATP